MITMEDRKARERFEKHRAELYMSTITELRPWLWDLIDKTEDAHKQLSETLAYLGMVKKQIERLDIITESFYQDPESEIRDVLTMDVLIQKQLKESFVYFVEAGDYIKIGYSRDPIGRLAQIRRKDGVSRPEGLDTSKARMLAVEEGGQDREKFLHKRFAASRVRGEWFAKTDQLNHYIKSISSPSGIQETAA